MGNAKKIIILRKGINISFFFFCLLTRKVYLCNVIRIIMRQIVTYIYSSTSFESIQTKNTS